MKQEFEMQQSEMDEILRINKEVQNMPLMKIGNYANSGQELAEAINAYWAKLGEKYGFKPMTVEGSSKGKLFFLAEPTPKVIPKTPEEIEMDKYDTLSKIIEQLDKCNYQTSDTNHDLNDNIAYRALKRMAKSH